VLRECLRLVKQGVPWNEAWNMSPARRLACLIAFGEMDGGIFDWQSLCWREAKS
jgi:hypothetical protein